MEYDSSEYVLASTTALFYPAAYVLAVTLAAYLVKVVLGGSLHSLIRAGILGAAVALVAAGIFSLCGVISIKGFPWEPPVLVAAVFVTLGTARFKCFPGGWKQLLPLRWGIFGCVLLLGFWWVSLYAQYRGSESALATAQNLNRLPKVVLTSSSALGLPGETIKGPVNGVFFQEEGRYLLAHSGSTLAMLSLTWPGDGRSYVVRMSGDIKAISIIQK